MRINFYLKMALRNIRANKQLYFPYALSAVMTVAMFFQMLTLATADYGDMRGADTLVTLFGFGVAVIGLFSLVFLLYANSFLIKRRKKEMGLYGILGLEKRHVGSILFVESLLVGAGSILLGLAGGAILGQLIFLFLNYLSQLPVSMNFQLQGSNFILTALLFMGVFFVAHLYNVSQVTFSDPIQLLKGEKEGEREPKSNLFLFLLGVVLLGSGYWISVTISDPLTAMLNFFTAVLLVIAGTYFLFTAGSIYILKKMKKNKKRYYQPRAFISISGMLYRMKQNATGLANISILACMVIIAVGTTLALYVGIEDSLAARFPTDHDARVYYDTDKSMAAIQADVAKVVDRIQAETDTLEITDSQHYVYATVFGNLVDGTFRSDQSQEISRVANVISAEEFNRIEGMDLAPEPGELYLHDSAGYTGDTIRFMDEAFAVQPFTGEVKSFSVEEWVGQSFLLVAPDKETIDRIYAAYETADAGYDYSVHGKVEWNTTGTEEEIRAYAAKLRPLLEEEAIVNYQTPAELQDEWYAMYGGFLFLGVYLGLLFIIGTILITYFKQVSEGYDDRARFQIMQKVGLDEEMIRDTSRSQVVWMFILPLLVATIHTAFAYPIIHQLLMAFGVTSHQTLLISIGGVVLAFSLIYWLIYRVTARVYYSIVK